MHHRSEQTEVMSGIQAALDLEPEILAAAFEPARKVVITGGNDKIIKVWCRLCLDDQGVVWMLFMCTAPED
jgi:hypothetical protein